MGIGDLVELLLSISFACKDALLDWEWRGIDTQEWPLQRLDWEMCRIEHLAFVSNMEASFSGWLQYPWHIGYSALRCMACQPWQVEHMCPICKRSDRNHAGRDDPWAYMEAA